MYRHILVPTDGSPLSMDAAHSAIDLARALGARMTALHVLPQPESWGLDAWTHADAAFEKHLEQVLEKRGHAYLETVRDMARLAGVACDCAMLRSESPHAEILAEGERRGCDLIVMASHGRKGRQGVLLASETIKVMTLGSIPVLVLHGRAPRPEVRAPASARPRRGSAPGRAAGA